MKRQLTAAFICLHCRKVFKRPSHRLVGGRYEALDYEPLCPQCQTPLIKVGDAFRAPAKDDLTAWEKIEQDISEGRTFVRDEGFGRTPPPPKRQPSPKGLHSLFQLPARKRRKRAEQTGAANRSQPVRAESNQTSSAAGSGRWPFRSVEV